MQARDGAESREEKLTHFIPSPSNYSSFTLEAASVRKRCLAYAVTLCCLATPACAAGIQLLDSGPELTGAIWYPCAAEPQSVPLGSLAVDWGDTLSGVKDCPVEGTGLPLVIISHGGGGWFGGHHDVAEALADAGFVVAAISHPGDTAKDSSQRDSLSVLASRPADIVRLLDFLLADWKDRAAIDRARIGFYGFSSGGYTGLVLVGANPDFRRIAPFCGETNKTQACAQIRSGDIPPSPPHDARIRAAAVADAAATSSFARENLAGIRVPLQVWRSELGGGTVDAAGVARVTLSLPGTPEIHVVPAGHYAFLPPCTPRVAASSPRFCTDPLGFDRKAFHRDLNGSVVGFFRKHLVGRGEAR
jgi:predicted dienelactone hydrolase